MGQVGTLLMLLYFGLAPVPLLFSHVGSEWFPGACLDACLVVSTMSSPWLCRGSHMVLRLLSDGMVSSSLCHYFLDGALVACTLVLPWFPIGLMVLLVRFCYYSALGPSWHPLWSAKSIHCAMSKQGRSDPQTPCRILEQLFLRSYGVAGEAPVQILFLELMPTSLARHLRVESAAMPDSAFDAIAKQMSRALHFLHDLRLIHCDVKPGNILWQPFGERAVLADFSHSTEQTPKTYMF